jgi:hypothetical protein
MEILAFKVDTSQSTPEVARLVEKMEKLKAEAAAVNDAFQRGDIFLGQYKTHIAALNKEMDGLANRINKATTIDPGKAFAKNDGLFGFGKGQVKDFARLADDLQYVVQQGLRPITGQLVEINPLLGVAAIGFQQLLKVMQDGSEAMSGYIDGLKKLNPEMTKQLEIADLAQKTMLGGGPKAGLQLLEAVVKERAGFSLIGKLKESLGIADVAGPSESITKGEEAGKKARDAARTEEEKARALGVAYFLENNKSDFSVGDPKQQANVDLALSRALGGTETGLEMLKGALTNAGAGDAAGRLGEIVRGFMPDNAGDQADAAFDLSNQKARERRLERERAAAERAAADDVIRRDQLKAEQEENTKQTRDAMAGLNAARQKDERRHKMAEQYARQFYDENKPRPSQVFGDAMSYINSMQTAGAMTPQHETNQILRDIAQKFDRQIQLIEDAGGLVVEP